MQNGSYEVSIEELGCSSENSIPFAFEKEVVVIGVLNELASKGILIFPNPVEYELNVNLEATGYNKMMLIDNVGKVMRSKALNIGQNVLLVDELAAGIYTLQIIGSAGSLEYKVVVQ